MDSLHYKITSLFDDLFNKILDALPNLVGIIVAALVFFPWSALMFDTLMGIPVCETTIDWLKELYQNGFKP
ncbi:hypothetical protein Q9L42_020900 (plasmid) [Methylomarinum sp. Ch1-1]|uniref:TMhelix containing protein n=1 Tax=Methylomarinum roseum TaxID=3067653 RepID=A0AAU7P0J1_9GAMM|nr:hypothetical protein [Methylomarinum sp. Ch1-1]MDP4518982.1 hypothetical protein [Methylomarinum sp. Ch1-1]MDP4523380.1 hypothetical protein [Methylomarinum sp. Ch1-1]